MEFKSKALYFDFDEVLPFLRAGIFQKLKFTASKNAKVVRLASRIPKINFT